MNKARRSELSKIVKGLNEVLTTIASLNDSLEMVRDEEEAAYDNLPEGLQYSERGDTMQQNIDDLTDSCENIDGLKDSINDIIENIENVMY